MQTPTLIDMLGPWGAAIFFAITAAAGCVVLGELYQIVHYALQLGGHQ